MHMAFFSSLAVAGVNANELGAVAFGLLSTAPKVDVAGDGIAALNDNQFGFGKEFGLHAELATQGVHQALAPGRCANGSV